MSLSISRIVKLTIEVPQLPPTTPSFSGVLILGKSTKLPLRYRVKSFTKDTLSSYFSVTDPEYKKAALMFAQQPSLDRVHIGRRFAAAQAGSLSGGAAGALNALKAITTGKFDIVVDATTIHVTGLDLSSCTTMADVASALQTKLAAGLASTTCVVNAAGTGFDIVSPTTGTSSQVGYATNTSDDTTTSTTLGLSVAAGAQRTVGIAAESTVTDSLNASKRFNGGWFSFTLASDADLTDQQLAADWAETNARPYEATTSSQASFATPTSGDTDIAGYAMRKAYKQTFATYSTDTPDAGAGALARIAVVDYNQKNSVITLWGKRIAGVAGENIDEDQFDGLRAKNCNVVAAFGANPPIYTYGTMADGTYIDQVFGLAWLNAEVLTDLYAALTSVGRIAQTDEDVAKLVQAFEIALKKGVNCGLLAPGRWPSNIDGVGNVKPGDLLPDGFYVYADPVYTQSPTDRAARISPPITALACGSGAVQFAGLKLVFSP